MLWQEGRKPLCTTIVGYVSDSQTDLQSPVQFALSYSLVQVTISNIAIVFLITVIIALFFIVMAEQEEPLVEYNTGKLLPLANSRPILNQQQVRLPWWSPWSWCAWWWGKKTWCCHEKGNIDMNIWIEYIDMSIRNFDSKTNVNILVKINMKQLYRRIAMWNLSAR